MGLQKHTRMLNNTLHVHPNTHFHFSIASGGFLSFFLSFYTSLTHSTHLWCMLVYCTYMYSYKHVHVHMYSSFSVRWYIVHVCILHFFCLFFRLKSINGCVWVTIFNSVQAMDVVWICVCIYVSYVNTIWMTVIMVSGHCRTLLLWSNASPKII